MIRFTRRAFGPPIVLAALLGTFLVALAAGPTHAVADVRADANGYEIIINIPARELHLYRDGIKVKTYPIGVGSVVSPSRLGTTEIINSVAHPTYYPPDWYLRGLQPIPPGPDNPVGTRWLGLGWPGYGIHGTNRPESIGTASSAGCIRMYNEDVEELASIVGIGTPVTFVYEPVEVHTDALTGRIMLRVHRDIYRVRDLEPSDVVGLLAARHIDTDRVSPSGIKMLLQQASGQLVLLPTELTVVLGDQTLAGAGFRIGAREYVSADRLLRALQTVLGTGDADVTTWPEELDLSRAAEVDGERFFDPETLASALGLALEQTVGPDGTPGVRFRFTRVRYGDTFLPWRAYREHSWVLLPVADFAQLYGFDVEIDTDREVVYVAGRPVFGGRTIDGALYLPHDRLAALFGVPISWDPTGMVVTLGTRS